MTAGRQFIRIAQCNKGHLSVKLLGPGCREQLIKNLGCILMEDNSLAHNAFYTTWEREKVTIAEVNLEILGLPGIIECFRALNGANGYHA